MELRIPYYLDRFLFAFKGFVLLLLVCSYDCTAMQMLSKSKDAGRLKPAENAIYGMGTYVRNAQHGHHYHSFKTRRIGDTVGLGNKILVGAASETMHSTGNDDLYDK